MEGQIAAKAKDYVLNNYKIGNEKWACLDQVTVFMSALWDNSAKVHKLGNTHLKKSCKPQAVILFMNHDTNHYLYKILYLRWSQLQEVLLHSNSLNHISNFQFDRIIK